MMPAGLRNPLRQVHLLYLVASTLCEHLLEHFDGGDRQLVHVAPHHSDTEHAHKQRI
jgi:hypothetical protein